MAVAVFLVTKHVAFVGTANELGMVGCDFADIRYDLEKGGMVFGYWFVSIGGYGHVAGDIVEYCDGLHRGSVGQHDGRAGCVERAIVGGRCGAVGGVVDAGSLSGARE